ncbi:hypothetical protein [Nocardia colli]|uniref:hypothetical protein n=1 Tax=Nocardia colli TaxID=2545717 RepID=UPI0035DB61E6
MNSTRLIPCSTSKSEPESKLSMSHDSYMKETPIKRDEVLLVQKMNSGRVSMPVGDQAFDCLVTRFEGFRTAHQPATSGYVMVGIAGENVVDVVELIVANAIRFFPDQMRGVRLVKGIDSDSQHQDAPAGQPSDGPWIKVSQCGFGFGEFNTAGELLNVACPSMFCAGGMAPVVDGKIGEHAGVVAGRCPWIGTRVVDDRADFNVEHTAKKPEV